MPSCRKKLANEWILNDYVNEHVSDAIDEHGSEEGVNDDKHIVDEGVNDEVGR